MRSALAATTLIVLACAAPADAVVLTGTVSDPAGGRPGGADLRQVTVAYDSAGAVSGTVVTRAPAFAPIGLLEVIVGTASVRRGYCAAGFQEDLRPVKAGGDLPPYGSFADQGGRLGEHDLTQSGAAMSFSTTAGDFETPPRGNLAALANKSWNCAVAVSLGPGTHREGRRKHVYDQTDDTRVFPLVAGPPASCDLTSRTRRGRIRARCVNVDGPVTVRVHRRGRVLARRGAAVAGGLLSVSSRRMRRKRTYVVSIWRDTTMLAAEPVLRR